MKESVPNVPSAAADAVVDPHWLELQPAATLPSIYLPAVVPGTFEVWRKLVAVGLCSVFVLATSAGVCLTYGPSQFHW